jgi:hypothetical protein
LNCIASGSHIIVPNQLVAAEGHDVRSPAWACCQATELAADRFQPTSGLRIPGEWLCFPQGTFRQQFEQKAVF